MTTANAAETWQHLTSTDARQDGARLAELFAQGAATPLSGAYEGQVLGLFGTTFLGFVDVLVRAGRLLGGIGWTGKTFDTATGTGFNRLTTTSRIPMFLAMPRYGFSRRDGELTGFHFDHGLDTSPVGSGQQVWSVRYDNPAHANPLVLPRTRDELVEVAPGVHLGRALLDEGGRWQIVAYFALRQIGS